MFVGCGGREVGASWGFDRKLSRGPRSQSHERFGAGMRAEVRFKDRVLW